MKKILLFMAALMMAVCIVSCGSNEKKPQAPPKSPKEIYMDTLKAFKSKAIDGLSRYLKNHISSDPSVGEVLKTKDYILNDSMYLAKTKVLIKNQFGAKEQYNELYFSVCKNTGKYYMIVWPNEYRCQRGLSNIIDSPSYPSFVVLSGDSIPAKFHSKIYSVICSFEEMEELINDF